MGGGDLLQRPGKGAAQLRRFLFPAGIPGHPPETDQVHQGHRVSRGDGPVVPLLGPEKKRLAVVRRGKETPVGITEVPIDDPLEVYRRAQIVGIEACLVSLDQSPDEKGVIVEIGRHGRLSLAEAVEETSVGHFHLREDEPDRLPGRLQIPGFAQNPGRQGQGRDHQAVPVGEDLVVPLRAHTLFTGSQEAEADGLQALQKGCLRHSETFCDLGR